MIPTDPQKKLYFFGLIGAAILGGLFLIWAVFLNRGTITINAAPPYILSVKNSGDISCNQAICSTIVAPGKYTITLKKTSYKDQVKQIDVPFMGEHREDITFQFLPVITRLDPSYKPVITEDTKTATAYLERNPENNRQTLYLKATANAEPIVVTSFIRDLDDYQISIAPHQSQIILIDKNSEQATLYLIDLKNKTRTNLFSYPIIRNLKWLPDDSGFIFQAHARGGLGDSLFYYEIQPGKLTTLDLKTSLSNIAVIDKNHLIAATTQTIPGSDQGQKLEDQLVTLGENQGTPEVSSGTQFFNQTLSATRPFLAFIDYTLTTRQSRLITGITNDPLPDKVQLSVDQKTLYFFQGEQVSSLRFKE